jgi:hypothetical protein
MEIIGIREVLELCGLDECFMKKGVVLGPSRSEYVAYFHGVLPAVAAAIKA